MNLEDILTVLRRIAPEDTAMPGDPVGLLIGPPQQHRNISKVGVCLDATPDAARQAVAGGIDLVIAHHPLIYHPLKTLLPAEDPTSQAVTTLLTGGVGLYAMHTNWDRAAGGINDTLAALLGLADTRPFTSDGLPRIGSLPVPLTAVEFARQVGAALDCTHENALRWNTGGKGKMISSVAVCGGAGAFLMARAIASGADAYVTSDVRHHEFLEAAGRGLTLFDAGHGATETPGMHALAGQLAAELPEVEVVWVGPD